MIKFAVVATNHGTCWGPFDSKTEATKFRDFIRTEVDPAEVRVLCSPVLELLNWRDTIAEFRDDNE